MSDETTSIKEWIDDPNGEKCSAFINLIFDHYPNGEHWVRATVKFDGCVHFRKAYNTPFPKKDNDEDQDYIHICDIDEMIEQLTLLKEIAIKHFCEEGFYS